MRAPLSRAALAGAVLSAALTLAAAGDPSTSNEESLAQATQEVAYMNLEKARTLFQRVRAASRPGQAVWERAIFGEATCIWHLLPIQRENAEQAARLFTELLREAPASPLAPRAMMSLGRILELPEDRDDPIDLPGARAWYQKVIDGWPRDPIAGEATLRVAGTYVQTFNPAAVARGVALLRDWVTGHPSDPLASVLWQYLADTYFFPLGDYQHSLEAYEKVDELGWTEQGVQGKYYWRVAQMSERFLENREAAIKYYNKIIDEQPNSGKAYESEVALRRLGAPVHEPAMVRLLREQGDLAPSPQEPGRP